MSGFSIDCGVTDVRVHGGRVVTPDCHLLYRCNRVACLKSKLSDRSIVIESIHSCEVLNREVRCVVLANKGVSVARVSNNNSFGITSAVVIDCSSNINKDFTIVLEEISALDVSSTGL